MKKTVTVVIPVYNEEGGIDALCERLEQVRADRAQYDWRVVFVDDGSRDRTVDKLRDRQRRTGEAITILRLTRNFGHQAALKAGLDHADGDAVVMMDADLQHPPELIGRFLGEWELGYQVVQAVREADPAAEGGVRRAAVRGAYRLINRFAERPIPPEGADFRLIDRQVLSALRNLPEVNPMLRGLVAWVGFSQTTVAYRVQKRFDGRSRFPFRQLANLLAGGIFDLSRRPLGLAPAIGTVMAGAGVLSWLTGLASGLMGFILVLSAVELWGLGLVGAYLGRAYREALDRPMYLVSERVNFEDRETS